MAKITIIDGNSLLFRAYFATAYPGVEVMRNKEGIPTNAIFAFSNMINKILADLKEDERIMVAFDAGKQTFRKEQLESYKANRKPTPEDLVTQFPIARDFLRAERRLYPHNNHFCAGRHLLSDDKRLSHHPDLQEGGKALSRPPNWKQALVATHLVPGRMEALY